MFGNHWFLTLTASPVLIFIFAIKMKIFPVILSKLIAYYLELIASLSAFFNRSYSAKTENFSRLPTDNYTNSLLVPDYRIPVSKTWRIRGSSFPYHLRFSTQRLAKKHPMMALRPRMKTMRGVISPR